MRKLRFLAVLLTVFVFTVGCENDQITPIENITGISEPNRPFSLEAFNENRALNLEVNWETPAILEQDSLKFTEYQTTDFLSSDVYKVLGVTEKNNETEYFVLLFLSNSDLESDLSYSDNLKDFSGTINWFDLNGEIVALEAFEQGQRVNLTNTEDINKSKALASRSDDCGPAIALKSDLNGKEQLASKSCYGGGGFYRTVTTTTTTTWFLDRGSAGWEYDRTDVKTTTTREWVSNGRDYANATSVYGGSVVRARNASNNVLIRDIATLERINSDNYDILLVPSCQSFEYADGPRVKAAAVSGIKNFFPMTKGIAIVKLEPHYFSLPTWWTNGEASNQTAAALEFANIQTKEYFAANPTPNAHSVRIVWERNIRAAMRAIGGDFTKEAPHYIRNFVPYKEDWTWARKDCRT